MLRLNDITKDYPVAGGYVHALKGISLSFRQNEFVSILGASGCGKTTLLNIIGGLDKYTSGDLIIGGVSTKQYGDKDWDTYRNHSIGFIFQSYHLIPHQTILQNVELALTISGVSREERRKRAIDALDKVGLKDRIHNKPNQLSGGQAQRVAIARALINDPEIVLADEPTGALDSVTSVQIMDLLKEISKDRLVIMVTHNPELAEKYSTRIIRLLDGLVTDDSMPYSEEEEEAEVRKVAESDEPKTNKGKKKKSSMSTGMAFMLSLKNLLSKFKRTLMVAIAGSIGIIGVSMVLAISAGVQGYIVGMQDDMLSGFPLTVTETSIDITSLMNMNTKPKVEVKKLKDKVYVDSLLETLMSLGKSVTTNNLSKDYVKYVDAMPAEYYNALQYSYKYDISNNIYTQFNVTDEGGYTSGVYSFPAIRQIYSSVLSHEKEYEDYAYMISSADSIAEMPDNYKYILSQYDVLASSEGEVSSLSEEQLKALFEDKGTLVMVLNDNAVTDITLGQFAFLSQEKFVQFAYRALKENGMDEGGRYNPELIKQFFEGGEDFEFFIGENAQTFKWYPNDTIFVPTSEIEQTVFGTTYKYLAEAKDFSNKDAVDLKVKLILQKKKDLSYGCLSSGLYHTKQLTDYAIENGMKSEIVKHINESENDYVQSLPYFYNYTQFSNTEYIPHNNAPYYLIDMSSINMFEQMFGGGSSNIDPMARLHVSAAFLGGNKTPASIKIYPLNFEHKDLITNYLDGWNDMCEKGETYNGTKLGENDIVKYTDTVGLIIAMISTMIQMITIALVAFTALSLVVSTVMVGIITYVSVVERIKEIGILRAVGARKKDIKRLFNAETFIIGLAAGIVGILITYLLSAIVNLIVGALAGVYTIAALPIWQAFVMVGISILLTLISGLIPASAAAKKDPVVALRTE